MPNDPLVYIAAPLFSLAEREFNIKAKSFVESLGIRTYLPQVDGGVFTDLLSEGKDSSVVKERLFNQNWQAVKESDVILIILDGRVPDEGACVEIGMGFALGKECLALKTDTRTFIEGYCAYSRRNVQ